MYSRKNNHFHTNEYANALIHRNIQEWNPNANVQYNMKENNSSWIHTYEGFDNFHTSRVSDSLSKVKAEYGTRINPETGQNQFYVEIPKHLRKKLSLFQKMEICIEIILLIIYLFIFQNEWRNILNFLKT